MGKTAKQQLEQKKEPKIKVLEADFAGMKKGQKMFVATPQIVNDYIRAIPFGETREVLVARNDLAKRNKCDTTCPVSLAIFIRIVAQAAIEEMEAGKSSSEITPFWRLVDPESKVAKKLTIDSDWIAHQRDAELA